MLKPVLDILGDRDDVHAVSINVHQARDFIDGEIPETVITAIDEAQARPFSREGNAYLVIEITPD